MAKVLLGVALTLALVVTAARGDPPNVNPIELLQDAPEQFYTNGKQIDMWNTDAGTGRMVTFWFGTNPKDSVSYRELIALTEANSPKIYYYEPVSRVFVGRYDMQQEGYSMLAPQDRKARIEEIPPSAFPPPGGLPAVADLFPSVPPDRRNNDSLMKPPATMAFPRFQQSEWEGFYQPIGGSPARVKANVSLRLPGGEFKGTTDQGDTIRGRLSNVAVEMDSNNNMFRIKGRWSAGRVGGNFTFVVMMMDLNRFQGTYTVDGNGREFIWDGTRVSR